MSKTENITTIKELRKRQRELRLETEISKRELSHSIGTTRDNIGEFLLKRVALPVGGMIFGGYLLKRLSDKDGPKAETVAEPASAPVAAVPADYAPPPSPAPAPRATPHARPPSAREQTEVSEKEVVNHSFDLAKIMAVGRFLIPAVRAINDAVKSNGKQQ